MGVDYGPSGYITFSRKAGAGNMVHASAKLMFASRASKMGGGLSLHGRGFLGCEVGTSSLKVRDIGASNAGNIF